MTYFYQTNLPHGPPNLLELERNPKKSQATMKKYPRFCLACAFVLTFALNASAADWPDWRGPMRDGISVEKNLPEKWSLAGDNLAWKLPYGGRSAPIVIGDRVCVQNSVGKGAAQKERVMCLNADTGKVIWEYRFNVYSTDVPTHRIAWASPVADPATGNIYAMGGHGQFFAL